MNYIKEYYKCWGSSKSFFALKNKIKGEPLLIIVPDDKVLECVYSELTLFADISIYELPPFSQNPFEEARPIINVMGKRAVTLFNILHDDDFILIATPYSILKNIPTKDNFLSNIIDLSTRLKFSHEKISLLLDTLGYIQVEFVTGKGEYNLRGGLVDIFPINNYNPIRLEFFDDEIESIFEYNVDTQHKLKDVNNIKILPCSDFLISTDEFINVINDERLKEKAETFGKFAGYHWLAPLCNYPQNTIFSYLPKNTSIVCFSNTWKDDFHNFYDSLNEFLPSKDYGNVLLNNFLNIDNTISTIEKHNLSIITEIQSSIDSIALDFKSTKDLFSFEKNNIYQTMNKSFEAINKLLKKKYKIILAIESDRFSNIIKNFSRDFDITITEINSIKEATNSAIYLYRHRISDGFISDEDKLALIADIDIFGFSKRKHKSKKKDVFNTKLSDLEEGDYIVHVNHGIGIYRGIKHLTIAGVESDFLDILYDGDDILYVPLQSISQIQKYIGIQDQKPKLNSLKSSAWSKLKKYAKESAKNVAEDLLRLYAERKTKKGFSFVDDGILLSQFERSFQYDETEDQLSAILDVYNDMEKEMPMERLVCGDVGFGKTEVAMRAACKAIANGKQVAVLVPTTILARQHYETFSERFKEIPASIDYISRYRTNKEIKDIIERTSNGKIDILIGTHKILNKELVFKDLALLIIDEEQRFGVAHKEKIAAIKRNIDTLTLSATPIPRTLQLSLSGIRDMSIIETPPENRLPVVVKVINSNEDTRKAISLELERGGQVFFLHNKVASIQQVAIEIKEMLPYAKVEYAHGQMDSKTIDLILQRFYGGQIDVLVSTTIIENGIDIPNVNTIIIDNAGRFGLSQLYQLKGRVGRASKRGYCYLSIKDFSRLSPIAQKRLSIIQQLSDLGSGFKIAMYDLQLRGAGNILGAEQSGFIVKVGYELYVKMIEDAVNEMRGDFTNITDAEINSNISYFLPVDYIEDPRIRFDYYRRLSDVYNSKDMQELIKEIEVSFGELPIEVLNLSFIMLIKNLASRLGILKVIIASSGAKIQFSENTKLNPLTVSNTAKKQKIIFRFLSEYELSVVINGTNILNSLLDFFEDIINYQE